MKDTKIQYIIFLFLIMSSCTNKTNDKTTELSSAEKDSVETKLYSQLDSSYTTNETYSILNKIIERKKYNDSIIYVNILSVSDDRGKLLFSQEYICWKQFRNAIDSYLHCLLDGPTLYYGKEG